ncbi:MAG: glycosyltransferase 61 family protein [Methylovulum sp.]|uniref:glycosyltransferase family 61 protein n=1 Tax=Methylovulum sp. TaxID=1916980 RepID=UPI00261B20BE|nr:glycosyltransferase 61 family protein [Methylovulum sp.]MDD2725038.1 glycosyltransferase 61 family protein [Methylovulum sp.]
MNLPPNFKHDLTVVSLKNCFISQLRGVRPNDKGSYPGSVNFIGGIYDAMDRPHTGSLLKRGYGQIQEHEKNYTIDRSTVQTITGKAVYGGIISNHYGHFLLETLSRAWYLIKSSEDIYFYRAGAKEKNGSNDGLMAWQKEILSHLVIDIDRFKIIDKPLIFEELIIPGFGYIIETFFAQEQAAALIQLGEKLTGNKTPALKYDKVWLSRSLQKKGAIAGEKKFEQALHNEGFTIVHPEKLSLTEQIGLFENASVVAGFTGSAFHTLIFAKNKGVKLLHFSRVKRFNENFSLCSKANGFESEFYNFFLRFGGEIKGANANVLQDLNAIWNVLFDQGLVKTKGYSDPELTKDLEILDSALKNRAPRLFKAS